MEIHLDIADGFQLEIEQPVFGKQREHVVEKRDAGIDGGNPRAVDVQREFDLGLRGLAAAGGGAGRGHVSDENFLSSAYLRSFVLASKGSR